MADAAYDTIAETQRFQDAGFEQAQAEAITRFIRSHNAEGSATKGDLERVEERLGSEIKLVHKDVEALDTKIDSSIAALDRKIDTSIAALDAKIDTSIAALDQKIDLVKDSLETKIGAVDQKIDSVKDSLETKIDKQGVAVGMQIANLQAEFANGVADIAKGQTVQLRWMIGLLITCFLGIGGLVLAALRILVQSG